MLEPTTLRSSSASAVRRETSSPLRVRSKKPASSAEQVRVQACCAGRRPRVRRAARRNRSAPRWPAPAPRATTNRKHERAIDVGAAGEALVDHVAERDRQAQRRGRTNSASASSQATNRPRCGRTNGHSARRRRSGLWAGSVSCGMDAGSLRGRRTARCPRRIDEDHACQSDSRTHPVTGGVAQAGFQGVDAIGGQAQTQARRRARRRSRRALSAPRPASAACTLPMSSKRGSELQLAQHDQRRRRRGAQAFGRRAAVGAHQSAGAELDAAVPAGDHDHHLVVALAVDRGQDRPARGAGGLAVVAGAVLAADPVGPAVVGGIGIGDLARGTRARRPLIRPVPPGR